MVNSINLYGYEPEKLLKECNDPITLCRLGAILLATQREKGEKRKEGKGEVKRRLLEDLIKKVNETYRNAAPIINSLLDSLEEALRQHYESRLGGAVFKARARAASRLIIHSKNDTSALIFEYGTVLHPIFGVPYIPASSLKGVLRSYLESNLVSDLSLNSIEEVLGTLEHVSQIIITDGFPVKEGKKGRILEPEVTTPIYVKSIKEHEVKPIPVIYPAVAEGVEFVFIVAARKEAVKYFDKLKSWIKTTLWEGVGAKTMLGYGVLEVGI